MSWAWIIGGAIGVGLVGWALESLATIARRSDEIAAALARIQRLLELHPAIRAAEENEFRPPF
jgi:hypothetical protein